METIFALSSGKGKTGVSVIRISGSDALKCLNILGIDALKPRMATLCKLKDRGEIIDNALGLYFNGPNSFTGEDVIELHVHGSIAVVSNVLNILSGIKNFRLAEAGEFSKRAFQNGKMDLVQAEGLADLIEAETSAQAKQAIRAMEGEASKIYDNWRTRVIEIMAFIEAYIDFPDENIPHDLDIQAQAKVQNIITEIETQVNNDSGERIRDGVIATIIGAPNVGKSSLINYLTKRDIAIVSEVAGTTRDFLEAHLNIAGMPLTLIDTAGIRESADAIEQEGVKRALQKAENADFKIIMLDAEQGSVDEKIKKFIEDKNNLVVVNKIDLQKSTDYRLQTTGYLNISIKENAGTENLISALKEKVEKLLGDSENSIITRKRHKTSLQGAVAGLNEFINSRKNNAPIELCAENLRSAAVNIGNITGKIGVEDILDKIFSEFCIGK